MDEMGKTLLAVVLVGLGVCLWLGRRGGLRSGKGAAVFALVVISGEAEGLEERVRALGRLSPLRLCIAAENASAEALHRAALLCGDTGGLLCPLDSLPAAIKESLWTETQPQ